MSELQKQVRELEEQVRMCVFKNTQLKLENRRLAAEATRWREIAYKLEFRGGSLDNNGADTADDEPVPYRVTAKGDGRPAGRRTITLNPDEPPRYLRMDGGGHEDGAKTVAVDLDGVLAKYDGEWNGEFQPIGIPIVDVNGMSACKFTQALREFGYRITIHTCRTPRPDGHDDPLEEERIVHWLKEHGIEYDELHGGPNKPIAEVYLDDRGCRFTGRFLDALHDICNVRPHWSPVQPPYRRRAANSQHAPGDNGVADGNSRESE